ncbi:MAG: dihydroorotate dehydrogenase electron transfer subunit [Clostridia bacterium]|nr:dihydroorotate dehydrogenase electron transfer subunit [Clostridia bacterium]
MKQGLYKITENVSIAKDIMRMTLCGDTSAITAPGQFVNIKLDGFYLRRPISICDYDDNSITLIYKIVGEGTQALSEMDDGVELDLLVGLGNGYDVSKSGEKPLLIGGGVGVPPLYNLCKKLVGLGKEPTVILGFNSAQDVFYEEQFKALGAKVLVTTADGSHGIKGFVTDAMKDVEYSYFFTCGPMPMFKAIEATAKTSGQYSFEERMGCGFGACMGCSCKTKYGNKRICKDGPVLEREEIVW